MDELEQFIQYLPIDDDKYNNLIESDGLNGFRLNSSMHGNVVLIKDNKIIKHLNGDSKHQIIEELNSIYKRQ
jgi:hypothetical protein